MSNWTEDDYMDPEDERAEEEANLMARLEAHAGAVERAYGLLWCVHSGRSQNVFEARKELLTVLTKDGQRRGIEYAVSLYGPTTEAEIALMDEPLTDAQRSVLDGTFGVKSSKAES